MFMTFRARSKAVQVLFLPRLVLCGEIHYHLSNCKSRKHIFVFRSNLPPRVDLKAEQQCFLKMHTVNSIPFSLLLECGTHSVEYSVDVVYQGHVFHTDLHFLA